MVSNHSRSPTISSFNTGRNTSPIVTLISSQAFFVISSCELKSSLRFVASVSSASAFSQAALASSIALLDDSVVAISLFIVSVYRIVPISRVSKRSYIFPPAACISAIPSIRLRIAASGFSRHALTNASAETPAKAAKASNFSPPSKVASSMFAMNLDIELPPVSAVKPTLTIAADRPRTPLADIPTMLAAPVRRRESAAISLSVPLYLLPKSTSAAPSASTSSPVTFIRVEKRPMKLAADSSVRLVVYASLAAISIYF